MPLPAGNGRRAVVRVSRSALLDMLMAVIESAAVPPSMRDQSEEKFAALDRLRHKPHSAFRDALPMSLLFSTDGLPVAGLLFGREDLEDGLTTFHVERAFPRSANRHDFGLWTSERSPAVMAEVARAVGAPFEIVGDFFSRPRLAETPIEIAQSRVFRLERTKATVPEFEGDRVALAMTVTRATEAAPNSPPRGPAVQFRVGDTEVWLAALLRHRRMPTQGPELVIEWPGLEPEDNVASTGF